MIEYYIYFFILWFFAFIEFFTQRKKIFFLGIIIFFLFLSLRVDTGYDWPVYKNIFESLNSYSVFEASTVFNQEIGFVFVLSILQYISDDFQIVILIISLIEAYALYKFLIFSSKTPSVVLAIIGTWLIFTLYFSVLRQGLAVSFFFLFIVYIQQKKLKAYLMILLAVSIQVSSFVYFLLYFLSSIKIKKSLLIFLFISSLGVGFFSENIAIIIFSLIQKLGIPVLSSKMDWYISGRITHVNIFDRFFVYSYSIVMFIFLYKTWDKYKSDLMIRLSFFAMIYILFQLLFIEYPLIRNRIQYVSFTMQFILIFNYFYNQKVYFKLILFSSTMIIIFSYYTLMLMKSNSIVFVPYQDYIRYGILDSVSTGETRQEKMFDNK